MVDVGPGAGVTQARQTFMQSISFGINRYPNGGEGRFGPGKHLEELIDLVPQPRRRSEDHNRHDPEEARDDHEYGERRC